MARFYSDITNKLYDSMDDLEEAEKKIIAKREEKRVAEQKRADERKARAQEIDELQKTYVDARKAYTEALEKFCNDYGTFHQPFSNF